ncbi:uncharacterized protein [Arachis hypogaea]|uniref:uncharacterized protein n=1 Tax=Arachis hypogaea TaxID=3818 RepID=UPI000DEC6D1E|nr:uncharacterized protein LOC112794857 [Arachis hypogaea]
MALPYSFATTTKSSVFSKLHNTSFFQHNQLQRANVVTVVNRESKDSSEDNIELQAKGPKLEIGSPIIFTEAPKMIKTTASVLCLRVNSGLVKPGDVGRWLWILVKAKREKGFMPNYWIWTEHGEIDDIGINQTGFNNCGEGGSGSGANVEECDMKIAPEGSAIPRDYYEAKKLVQKLGLKAIKIDCCSNNCMLYRKDDAALTSCKFCEAPRFKPISDGGCKSKRVPVRRMHYLPLIPRLRRLYALMSSALHMTWHIKNQRDDGVMTHPSHGEALKSFDRIHSDFALVPRNIRLGLCSDGFTPNIQFSKPYSCWPNPGVLTYDIVEKKNFVLKAALMWTINDFPAYGMLSRWMTQGRLSCPICMEDTKSFTLSHGGKASWFDCHRRFLPTNHPYRRNKNDFRKNKIESEEAPTRLSGLEIWQRVKGLGKISDNGKWIKSREYEKNVLDNIMNTIMDIDRTKDNEKARLDLAELCKHPDLHLRHVGDNCWSKPKATYTLTSEQQQDMYWWVQQLRFPDGYASNLARCISLYQGRFIGMKSHDCHIFMQCLLPTAFRELPTNIWKPLTELSQFFKDLCSTTLKVHDLEVMEQNIPIILCKLERIFPPGFFNVMEHLPTHLAYEARVCGPVQYRWMYPFERVIRAFK